jgi:KDO2-lipid IV(A) lauroyltransferase
VRFLPRPSKWRYYLMFAVVHTIGRMPLRWRYGIARVVSDRIYAWGPNIGKNVRANVRQVVGPQASEEEIDRIARQIARSAGRYYADIVGMHRMNVQKFHASELTIDGVQYIREAQAAGRGVVMASAHYANPEFAVQGLLGEGITVFALVEPLEPPELGRLMRGLRTVHGHRYEPVGFSAIKNALSWLRNGGVVCILIDRDIQKRGVPLEFCGRTANFPTGAIDLCLRTNAVMLPGWVHRLPGYKVHADIGPPLELIRTGDNEEDLRVNTHRLLKVFERVLKAEPEQWMVLDRIWKDDPSSARPEHIPPK